MSLPPAELRLEQHGQVVLARVRGDIDMSNARELREQLSRRTPNEAIALIFDLTDLDYLDSTGIHLVHHLREDLRAAGQRLILVIPASSPVMTTLRLAGLNWVDDTVETVEEARDLLRPCGETVRSGQPAAP